jgi:hypothetical protein
LKIVKIAVIASTENNQSRQFLTRRIAAKEEELAKVEADLDEAPTQDIELKFSRKAERLIKEIQNLYNQLSELDKNSSSVNVRHLNLEKSFQKIDNELSKQIARKVNADLGDRSGAILLFLQQCTMQKGMYCLNEVLDLIISDRKIGDEIIGDFRPYPIDLDSAISKFNENEFSKTLASHLGQESEVNLCNSIKTLCSSLKGGSTIFIEIKSWDRVAENDVFLKWFIEEFWQTLICQLEPIFQEYSKIRFIVALIARSEVFPDCSSLDYFCKQNPFDYRKIIELPLPNWTVEDIQNWLINVKGFSNVESLRLANSIHKESKGIPQVVCSILEEKFKYENTR